MSSLPLGSSIAPYQPTEVTYSVGNALALINDLRSCGASSELAIPCVVVIGNQSAGKSSLIEAVAGIRVPRAQGTATRCRLEVRQRKSKTSQGVWSCQVSLRLEYNDRVVSSSEKNQVIEEVQFGPRLYDPALVEDMLAKAQLAILNPGVAASDIAELSPASVARAKRGELAKLGGKARSFSRNLICLDISGPQCCDLTFIDTPGLVSNVAEDGDPGDPDLILDLVRSSIQGNSLILVALSMKDDLENQGAYKEAKAADPKGGRTIGVLTKADTVGPGEHKRWFEVIRNERFALKHGYFCTKQPSQADLDSESSQASSHAHAREEELRFFDKTSPWTELDTDAKARLGTGALSNFLSSQLVQLIRAQVPDLRAGIASKLDQLSSELGRLPPATFEGNPILAIQRLLHDFVSSLQDSANASKGARSLVQRAGEVFEELRKDIAATEPIFIPLSEKGAVESSFVSVRSSSTAASDQETAPSRIARMEELEIADGILRMDILEMKGELKSARGRGISVLHTPYDVKEDLMVRAVGAWSKIAIVALQRLRPIVAKVVDELSDHHFGSHSALRDVILDAMNDEVVERLFHQCQLNIIYLFKLESVPRTLNNHYLTSTSDLLLRKLKAARIKRPPTGSKSKTGDSDSESEDAAATFERALQDDDEFNEELIVMAQVQAYWKVAYKRFVDNVTSAMDSDIIHCLHEGVLELLLARLPMSEVDGKEVAERLLAEDPDIKNRRNELKRRITVLTQARESVEKFRRGSALTPVEQSA
ncbi:hypothetical protein RQP46_009261 [Phenoliferia psychrophenolica]